LRGDLPAGWKKAFDRTVALLPGGGWGKVSLKKDRIRVRNVEEGCEDRLRHFLESVLQQANASAGPPEEKASDEGGADDDGSSGPDDAMTQRFRSFDARTDRAPGQG
jgi:hypothetical protein